MLTRPHFSMDYEYCRNIQLNSSCNRLSRKSKFTYGFLRSNEIVENGQKSLKMFRTDQKWPKWQKWPKIISNDQNGQNR